MFKSISKFKKLILISKKKIHNFFLLFLNKEKKKYFYILFESEYREMLPRMKIACNLAGNKNNVVSIMSKSFFYHYFKMLPPGVVLDKSAGPAISNFIDAIISKNFFYTVLEEEPFFYYREKNPLPARIDKKLSDKLSHYFFNGIEQKNIVKNKYKQYAYFIISGSPKYDLIRKYKENLYLDEIKVIKEKNKKPIILVVSNFGRHCMEGYSFSKKLSKYKNNDNHKIIEELRVNNLKKFKFRRKIMFKFIKDLIYLSNIYKDNYKFIIRPHPTDIPSFWRRQFKGSNVEINYQYNIVPWIYSSTYVILNNCTTAFETYFLNKKAINYEPIKKNPYECKLTKSISKNVNSLRQLKELLKYKNNIKFINKDKFINKYISIKSKKNSDEIISKVLIKLSSKLKLINYNISAFKILIKMSVFFSNFFNLRRESFLYKGKIPSLSEEYYDNKIKIMKKNNQSLLKINKISKEFYILKFN